MDSRNIFLLVSFVLFMSSVMFQCSSSSDHHGLHAPSVLEKVSGHTDSVHYNISSDEVMNDMKRILVKVHDTAALYIPERSGIIKSYPCSNCHGNSLDEMKKGLGTEDQTHAHWNISIRHADSETMDCTTCHDENNVNSLKSIKGVAISYDESYKQCAQCHSTQFKDWVGGAHGKRLGGYVPPRTINSCVNCHNPHAPAFAKRWPVRLNSVAAPKVEVH